MPLSPKEIEIHIKILDDLSGALRLVSKDLNLMIHVSHRKSDPEWKEVIEINLTRIEIVKGDIGQLSNSDAYDEVMGYHGLKGLELTLKSEVIGSAYNSFMESYGIDKGYNIDRSGYRSKERKRLHRYFKLADVFLGSMAAIFPPLGGVKEIKELIENSLGISMRK